MGSGENDNQSSRLKWLNAMLSVVASYIVVDRYNKNIANWAMPAAIAVGSGLFAWQLHQTAGLTGKEATATLKGTDATADIDRRGTEQAAIPPMADEGLLALASASDDPDTVALTGQLMQLLKERSVIQEGTQTMDACAEEASALHSRQSSGDLSPIPTPRQERQSSLS